MKGQLPRAYLRLDPLIDSHPDWPAMVTLILWANRQPRRGYFKSVHTIRKILGRKRLDACLARRDLAEQPDGTYYLIGWEEWQEGDLTVGDRVRRLRARRSIAVTPPLPERTSPSEASRRQGVKALGDISPKEIPEKAKRAAAVEGGPPPATAGAPWVDHDPHDQLETRLVRRCEELAQQVTFQSGGGPTSDEDRRDVLSAVTTTPKGKDLTTLRGASRAWLEQSLRACDDFERDLGPEPPAVAPAEESS